MCEDMLCKREEDFLCVWGPAWHLREAAALQLLHWAAMRLGSRSSGRQPWLLMLASTLLWACTSRGCRLADQSWWQLEQWADTWMLPDLPCWLPEATASDANASSHVAGHLLHTICTTISRAHLFFAHLLIRHMNSPIFPLVCTVMYACMYCPFVHLPIPSCTHLFMHPLI